MLLLVVMAIAILGVFLTQDKRPVGVIDQAGYLKIQQLPEARRVLTRTRIGP